MIRGLEMAISGRHLIWKIAPLPKVMGDAALLKQVLTNLIDNALKYSRTRDPATIEIGCAGDGGRPRRSCSCATTASASTCSTRNKLFGVFQRLHRPEEFEGTGIGLATVRRIIGRHGGRVWADGALDQGATVYFTLEPAAAAQRRGMTHDRVKRILLVEDSARDAELILDALGAHQLCQRHHARARWRRGAGLPVPARAVRRSDRRAAGPAAPRSEASEGGWSRGACARSRATRSSR